MTISRSLFRHFLTLCLLIGFAALSHAQRTTSHYITMEDGTRLAADVYLPADSLGERFPTLVVLTRYWRSAVDRKTKDQPPVLSGLDKIFSDHGYAIVKVDVRGTGASFGTRRGEYTPTEVMDAKDVVNWMVAQPWCDGAIGSYGTSYEGTTAELLCATQHPAVKAVIPGWSDFDVYRSPVRPYGMLASSFIKKWGLYVRMLDRNVAMILGERIRPVEKDLLKEALSQHRENPQIYRLTRDGAYRDSKAGDYTYQECSPIHWKEAIEASQVPMLVLTSWMDAGTAEGTLMRLQHYSNPQKVLLMATSHGGWSHASPFHVHDELLYPNPRGAQQDQTQLDFFDHYLKGEDKGVDDWSLVAYYNMGEEAYHETDVWPIPGTKATPFYFQENNALDLSRPTNREGQDAYKVDFSTTTGKKNRWTTQMGGGILNLDDRGEEDAKMLVYTTAPMTENLQITGTPTVTLQMSSTHEDGAVLVYLEDVDSAGQSRYITEGGLRLIHRKIADATKPPYNLHSFAEADAQPMPPGEVVEVTFKLWPTSVQIKKGHSLRVAIAGADRQTFDRVPKRGTPTLTVHRSASQSSFVSLPVVE